MKVNHFLKRFVNEMKFKVPFSLAESIQWANEGQEQRHWLYLPEKNKPSFVSYDTRNSNSAKSSQKWLITIDNFGFKISWLVLVE